MTVATLLFATATTSAQTDEQRVPERSEIDPQYTWKVEAIFASPAEWQAEYRAIEQEIPRIAAFRDMLDNPQRLAEFLDLRDSLEPRIWRVFVYTNLMADQDTQVDENQARKERARALAVKYSEATSWFVPALTSIPQEKIQGWMNENEHLALYRQYFHNLYRQKAHILTPREEELIAMAGQVFSTPGNTYSLWKNAELQFPTIKVDGREVELSDSIFYEMMRNPNRDVRHRAYVGIVGSYADYKRTAAALLTGVVQNHIFTKKARNYESCLSAALHGENIPVNVYNTLVETVNDNLPLLHRYTSLRRRVLNLKDGVHAYDLFAPFTSEQKLEYSYEDAVKTMTAALTPLGPDYIADLKTGLASRWVDVYPTRGKRSGAYSSGTFLTQPYILLNFHGGYDDMSTLAHEIGHSMHSFYSRGTQPYVYSDYEIFCAEVASTTNEILLQNYVLERITDPQQKLFLLVELLETFRGTVFRQTMFSEFEQAIHEMAERGEPLTADSLSRTYGEIMKRYYGPDYVHEITDPDHAEKAPTDLVSNYWIRIPHFYYNFYVYKYSTSFCAASAIAGSISAEEPGAVERYLKFLRSGSSKYPVELLQDAGVDMTTPKPINDAMKHFEHLLDMTEELLNEIQ